MRLLFITPTPPDRDDRDGMTQIAFRLIPELARHHTIDVWTLHDEQHDAHVPAAHATRTFFRSSPSILGYYTSGRRLPYFQYRHESATLHQALQLVTAQEYDLAIIHTPFVAHYLADLKIPAVVHVIDALSDWFPKAARQEPNILKRMHLRNEGRGAAQMERTILPRAKALTVVSDADATTLGKSVPSVPTTVIPIGIDTNTFYPPATPRDPATVVMTGVMNYPPNVDAALWFTADVWPRVLATHPDAQLRIVGKDPTPAVQALGHRPHVTVTGRVPSVAEELRHATIAVSPIRFGTGYKIKVNEALACGTPLVASHESLPGTGVTIDHDCLVATTTDEWVTRVTGLLGDVAARSELSAAAVNFAIKRSWASIAKQYEHLYERATT